MTLKTEWLYYFSVFAETCSFQRAAHQLFMTQQALSKNIAQLETRLGVLLVQRGSRENHLTDAGRSLLQKTAAITQSLRILEQQLPRFKNQPPTALLRLAAMMHCGEQITDLLEDLIATDQAQVSLYFVLKPAQIEQALLAHELEMAVMRHPPQSPHLRYLPLEPSEYVIVGRPRARCGWESLGYIELTANALDADFSLACWPAEYPRQIVAEADVTTAMLLAESGYGALFIPKSLVNSALHAGRLAIIADAPAKRFLTTYLVWPESGQQSWPESGQQSWPDHFRLVLGDGT